MTSIKQVPLVILDFGSQYTQLIARRIREMGVYCEIYPYNINENEFKSLNPFGVVLSGGPSTTTLENTPRAPHWLFEHALPLLGICYGMQTMAVQLGGQVRASHLREYGYAEVKLTKDSALFNQIADRHSDQGDALLDVWMSHGDEVIEIPADFEVLCETNNAAIAGMVNKNRNWYGLQFHPEVTHTTLGTNILKHFVLDICKAPANWTVSNIIERSIKTIRDQVEEDQVLLGISGGVDSSVVAALLHQAIGKRLIPVFIDTGLLRLHEKEEVIQALQKHLGLQLIVVDAAQRFLDALEGVNCPEKKRKIIGHTFVKLFEEEAQQFPDVKWLAQGTIYPDVIESAAASANGPAVLIKSHHNVGGLPETLNLKLLEPIRELFKDEVRKVGLELGLSESLIYRHPFPGPGLAVRIMGEIKQAYIDILRQADFIFIEELKACELYHKVSQAFAVFLPVKSVAIMGDGRCYDYIISLRAVETVDFMTAQWAHLPWDFLAKVSNRIINEVVGVSRVTYDISSKPPATIEWE